MSDLLEEYSVITSGSRRSMGLYIIFSKKKKKRERRKMLSSSGMVFFQKKNSKSILKLIISDDEFSIGTGFERAGFDRSVRLLWTAGARPLSLRCLSQFFSVKENINCLENKVLCISQYTFH